MSFDFFRLDNGVRVLLVPMSGVESTAVGVYVGTGSRYEPKGLEGVSHFLEHLAFKGTKKYPTYKDLHFLEGLGAIQNAWTDVDATAYWSKVPADKWQEAMDVASQLALYPVIPEKEMETERGVILEEIKMYEDRSDLLVSEVLQGMVFSGNTLGKPTIGTAEVIKSVTRAQVLAYHDQYYSSKNMLVIMAGKLDKFDPKKWFSDVKNIDPIPYEPFETTQTEPRVTIKKKKIEQTHVQIGFPTFSMSDNRRFAAAVMASVLGKGATSRLFDEVREKRGLCYTINASANSYQDTGFFDIYAGLGTDKLEDALAAIKVEVNKICEELVSEKELTMAKEKLRGPMLFSAENPISQMEFYARQAMHRPEEILDYKQTIERLMAVTPHQIQEVSQSIFLTQTLNLAVVGPVEAKRGEALLKLLKLK